MRIIIYLCVLLLSVSATFAADAEETLDENLQNPGYIEEPEWFKESFLDIREDIAEASAAGKRLLLYFHQDGCPYCEKLIRDNFAQRAIAEQTQRDFETISINMWGDREVLGFDGETLTEKDFARLLRVQFTPTMLFLDEDGKVNLRVNGYYQPGKFLSALEFSRKEQTEFAQFREFIAANGMLETTGSLHKEPGFMDEPFKFSDTLASENKPLLVFFEQKQCLACDELHNDILKRKQSIEKLERFSAAVVDMWSTTALQTPRGTSKTARQWADDLGINYAPTLVFFNPEGEEVFRTEAYLKAFHLHAAMDYVASQSYLHQPEFQRYIEEHADALREQGKEVDLLK